VPTHRALRTLAGALLFVIGASRNAGAQSLQFPLQFDFLNPGARSLALGSAFAGLADDATAAFTNPAGLTLLARMEASFEGRGRRLETPFLQRGRLSGTLTNQGVDTLAGPGFAEVIDTNGSVGFLSFVYPRNNWAIAGYTHDLLHVREEFETSGVFQQVTFQGFPLDSRELPQTGLRDVNIRNFGVSAAYRFSGVAIGAGFSTYKLKLESVFKRFDTNGFYGPADFSREAAQATQDADDIGFGGSVGVLWTISPKVRVGAVFRSGPDFDFEVTERAQPGSPVLMSSGVFRVPNTFSAGLVVRPTDALTITSEYTRVQYSALEEDFVIAQARTSGRQNQFFVEDGNEVHGGVEYVFTNVAKNPAIRFGAWFDPDHSVQFRPSSANDSFDERLSVALSQGKDLVHYTFGAGVPITERFEVNGAGDITSRTRVYSASVVVRF
jgi:long-chain fatty acid transport protein